VSNDPLWTPEARAVLTADPQLAPYVERHEPPSRPLRRGATPFGSLVRSIVGQQLTGTAARTIHDRLLHLVEHRMSPYELDHHDDDALRAVGLSRGKVKALRSLSEHAKGPGLHHLHTLTNEEVKAALLPIKGVGPWTVDMFLMFHLIRPDVWPTGDLGVRKGAGAVRGGPRARACALLPGRTCASR